MDIHDIVERSLSYLVEKGKVDDAIVSAGSRKRFQIRFSKNDVTVSKRWQEIILDLFLVKDKKIALTNLTDVSSFDKIKKALDELLIFTRSLQENKDYHGIAGGPFSYTDIKDTNDPEMRVFLDNAADKVETAINAAGEEGAINSAGTLEWQYSDNYLMNNHGITVESSSTNYQFLIRSFLSPKESGQGINVGRMVKNMDCSQAGKNAGYLAKLAKGVKPVKGGTYNALLAPTVVADIITRSVSVANPFSIEIGQSWLGDKISHQVASELFTASDDATVPNGYASQKADGEGVPTQKTTIFDKGVLKGLIYNTNMARKAGTESTGNAGIISPRNHNIVIEPGDYKFDEMIAECQKPTIYLTSNWYTRMTSAMEGIFSTTSRDAMFIIENGEIKQSIRELRINDAFPALVKNIVAVQDKVRQIKWWTAVTTPVFAPAMIVENVEFTTGTR
ncbi:MAG: TldD/PmbA family protein [Candidatus Hodarchaeales archaeon]